MHLKKLSFLTILLLSLGLTGCGSDNLDAVTSGSGDSSSGNGNDTDASDNGDSGGDTDNGNNEDTVYTASGNFTPKIIQRGQTFTFNYDLDKTPDAAVIYDIDIVGTAIQSTNQDYTISNASTLTFAKGSTTTSLTITTYQKDDVYDARTLSLTFTGNTGEPATLNLLISGNVYLNDTGISDYSDGSDFNLGAQPGGDLALQDAAYGLDVIINPSALANAGGDTQDASSQFYKNSRDIDNADTEYKGRAGFRFVKIGNDGMPRTANNTNYECVKDEITGLIWQIKGPTNTINPDPVIADRFQMSNKQNYSAANFTYLWNASALGTQGKGWESSLNDGPLEDAGDGNDFANPYCGYRNNLYGRSQSLYCSSGSYANEANFIGVCGQTNWMVPTVEQLRSIIDYSKVTDYSSLSLATEHALDSNFFDCTGNDCVISNDSNPVYWTSSQVKGAESLAWCINLQTGNVNTCNKDEARKVMLVSSNIPAEFFTQAADDSAESE